MKRLLLKKILILLFILAPNIAGAQIDYNYKIDSVHRSQEAINEKVYTIIQIKDQNLRSKQILELQKLNNGWFGAIKNTITPNEILGVLELVNEQHELLINLLKAKQSEQLARQNVYEASVNLIEKYNERSHLIYSALKENLITEEEAREILETGEIPENIKERLINNQ